MQCRCDPARSILDPVSHQPVELPIVDLWRIDERVGGAVVCSMAVSEDEVELIKALHIAEAADLLALQT
jgi:hypothetical protein